MSIVIDCGRQPCSERSRGIVAATAAVRRGELVVLPTEAAYGVGADAFHPRGMTRLRDAKGRGPDLPIPVLVASARMAEGIVTGLTPAARSLIEACWPGPLTLVARQQPTLAWGESSDTVSVRMPLHPLALALLESTGPLAVTTANSFDSVPLIHRRVVGVQSGQLTPQVILNVFGDIKSQGVPSDFLCLLHRNVSNEVLNLRNGDGSHAERPKPHSNQKWNSSNSKRLKINNQRKKISNFQFKASRTRSNQC